MIPNFFKFCLVALMMTLCSCVVEPAYDGGPPPAYGYYDYGPGYYYPWATGANIDIIGGYGHGGYGRGGYGRGGGGRGGRGGISRR
jgi:hypothetical protein